MSRPASRALALLLASAIGLSCNLRAPRLRGPARGAPCASTRQCGADSVCFVGECRAPSNELSLVLAEVRPKDARLATLQRGGINLRQQAVVDFLVDVPLVVNGSLARTQPAGTRVPLGGATLSFAELQPTIPGRSDPVLVTTQSDGSFSAEFPIPAAAAAGQMALGPRKIRVVPPDGPPERLVAEPQPNAPFRVVLAATNAAVRMRGTLVAAGTPVPGAVLIATDVGDDQTLATSAPTDPGGNFELLFAPPPSGNTGFVLRVSSASASSDPAAAPLPSYRIGGPFTVAAAPLGSIDVGPLPPLATLRGKVFDPRGSPVASARVQALSLDLPHEGVLARSVQSDADGTYALGLRAGRYVVQATLGVGTDQAALSPEFEVTLQPGNNPLDVSSLPRLSARGRVDRPDGSPVGQGVPVRISRAPGRVVAARPAASVTTDASGFYSFTGDPGEYRLEVAPPSDSNLPRTLATVTLTDDGQEFPPVQIAPPLQVVGTVSVGPGSGGGVAAGATVDFYAMDAAGLQAVLIGRAEADGAGRYRAVLPDVSRPAQ